jgi:cytosine/adenosine deaminase-related metal-dependent hydrolase
MCEFTGLGGACPLGRILLGALSIALFFHLNNAVAADWSIEGTILTPGGLIDDGDLTISGDTIASITVHSGAVGNRIGIHVKGIIVPGFIDLHDHLTWNVLPRWLPGRYFGTRYEWQDTPEYDRLLVAPHAAVMTAVPCEVEIYAEVKAMAGAATSVVGGLLKDPKHPENAKCVSGLVRNLDTDSGLLADIGVSRDDCSVDPTSVQTILDVVDNEVFPFEIARGRFDYLLCALDKGALRGLTIHLAEGAPANANAHREFNMLNKETLQDLDGVPISRAGLNIIHGTALRDADFISMRKSNVGLIWSARSNDELYGSSTNISSARTAGVPIAIAPDWSPSGSAGMLQEMGYVARRYQNFAGSDLISMATLVPATLARVASQVGTLEPGKKADFVVLNVPIDIKANHALDLIPKATPADVALVVVGGEAIYGDPMLLAALWPKGTKLDHLEVCGAQKAVYLGHSAAAAKNESFQDIVGAINQVLRKSGELIPEIECN